MLCGAIVLWDAASWALFLSLLSNPQLDRVDDLQDQTEEDLRGFASWWILLLSFDIFFIRTYALNHTFHVRRLKCPSHGFTIPPEESRVCHSCQWDLWVFYSPQANPLAPLPPPPPRPQNWSNHKWRQVWEWVWRRGWCWIYIFIAKTEQCWLNLTWVTFSGRRHRFVLISVNLCQRDRGQRRGVRWDALNTTSIEIMFSHVLALGWWTFLTFIKFSV